MNLKQLGNSQKMYTDIKALDAEIVEIEKVAMLIADGKAVVKLTMDVTDTSKKPEVKKEDSDYESEVKRYQSFFTGGLLYPLTGSGSPKEEQKKPDNQLKSELSDNLSLNVLAVLLYDKQQKRLALLNKLKRIGVTL